MKILGVNLRGHPSQNDPSGYVDYKVVLWESGTEFFNEIRASIGQGSDEWVARNGDSITLEETNTHFPGIRPRSGTSRSTTSIRATCRESGRAIAAVSK